ncbi:MAG: glycosyltransferase family 9 protein [Ignavibacteriae bacterium]|nr:glycosyltransferase family 9 protein [Ignavibacteriota bacterium]
MIIAYKNIIASVYLIFITSILKKRPPNFERNLLFINTEQIGDIVISSALLNDDSYYSNYDNVYFLIKSKYCGLLKNYKGKVQIIPFDKKRFICSWFYNFKFIKHIKSLAITEVYNVSPARGPINEILTHITEAPLRYTSNNDSFYLGDKFFRYWNKKYTSILYSDILNEYLKIEKLLNMLSPGSIEGHNNIFTDINKSSSVSLPYITISPYSSNKIKDWNVDNYLKLINEIGKEYKVYIICSPSQRSRAVKDFRNATNLTIRDCKLSDVVDLIINSKLFIGNDSGLTHLATKLGVQTVAIIGGGMYGRYFPLPNRYCKINYYFTKVPCFGCQWKCVYTYPLCLNNINIDVSRLII